MKSPFAGSCGSRSAKARRKSAKQIIQKASIPDAFLVFGRDFGLTDGPAAVRNFAMPRVLPVL
jgi:hypothetical protein